MGWSDRVSQHPVVMDGLAASVDLHRRLWQFEVLPCGELPFLGAVIPFSKEGTTGGDVGVGVAAIVDNEVNAAAFGLPFGDKAFAAATFATFVGWLVGVLSVEKCAQPDGTCRFAEKGNKPTGLVEINFLHRSVAGRMPSRCRRMDCSNSRRMAVPRDMRSARQESSHTNRSGLRRTGVGWANRTIFGKQACKA